MTDLSVLPFDDASKPVIPYADERNLDAESLAIFEKTATMLGVVPNAARTYAHRPDIAKLIHSMYSTIVVSDKSNLSLGLKVKLGVICSSVNGCVYCTSHQCSTAKGMSQQEGKKWGLTDEDLAGLISGKDEGGDDVERVCFEFARSASFSPTEVKVELLERMKAVLSSAQIVELGCVVSMWKFFNTMHDSLHIPSEGAMSKYWGLIDEGRAAAAA